MKSWEVTYIDGLQGKRHSIVVAAESKRQAIEKVEHLVAWQEPRATQAILFKQPELI